MPATKSTKSTKPKASVAKRANVARWRTMTADKRATLATFTLEELAEFKREGVFDHHDSNDFRVFYAGRDDVHGVLKYLLAHTAHSLYMNMFGYDDDELNMVIADLVDNQHIYVQGSLDKSQAGGVHEKKILAGWDEAMRNSFVVGQSATHQISHTKGGVCDGKVGWEGSTNWSSSGEGTIVDPAGTDKGRKAQNNTLLVYTNPVEVANFVRELNEEHTTMLHQQVPAGNAKALRQQAAAKRRANTVTAK